MDGARYPATDSTLEWANEIMAFDQILVEGFQLKPLRKMLEDKGKKAESGWASLRVLAESEVEQLAAHHSLAQDVQGRAQAMQTSFALHQLAHTHWSKLYNMLIDPTGLPPETQKALGMKLEKK